MCNPLVMTGLGLAQSALQISSVNSSVEAEAESLNRQVQSKYIEDAYEARERAEAAVEKGFAAEMTKRQAEGEALVHGVTMGIQGTTARELVDSETQAGNFNVAAAEEERRNADTAFTISTSLTHSNALQQHQSIVAKQPSMLESMVNLAAGGLRGYLSGLEIKDSMTGVPEGF